MKNIIYIILLGVISNYNNTKSNSETQTELKNLDCENIKALLINEKNNWEIPLEHIYNINDYISESNIQLKSPLATKGIEKTKYGTSMYSNIFPYVNVNGIEISLMQLIRYTGGGHSSNINDSYRVIIGENKKNDLQIKKKVFEFYRDFKPNNEYHSETRLLYPRIDLTFNGNNFHKIKDSLTKISLGFIKAVELESEKKFSKKICQLNKVELELLKKKFKLNIRIFKYGV